MPEIPGDPGRVRFFKDMVIHMDKLVGEIIGAVDELGIRKNTVIIFTGDNGTDKAVTSTMNGRIIPGGKGKMHVTGTHVPLIVSWKGKSPEGVVCSDLIDFTDFMPTLAELASTKPPGDRVIDGRSFLPQILGQKGNPRKWIFCQLNGQKSVRTHAWILHNDGRLFDLEKDPAELRPIGKDADTARTKQARARMTRLLSKIQSR